MDRVDSCGRLEVEVSNCTRGQVSRIDGCLSRVGGQRGVWGPLYRDSPGVDSGVSSKCSVFLWNGSVEKDVGVHGLVPFLLARMMYTAEHIA